MFNQKVFRLSPFLQSFNTLLLWFINAKAKRVISVWPEGDRSTTSSALFLITFMLCKITFVSVSSWLLTNAGENHKIYLWYESTYYLWTRMSFLLQVLLKQPKSLAELAEWVEFCSKCLIRIFRHPLMESIIIFEDDFLFSRSSDMILTSCVHH